MGNSLFLIVILGLVIITSGCISLLSPNDVECGPCPSLGVQVCTESGRTYSSECAAECAGESFLHEGPCLAGE